MRAASPAAPRLTPPRLEGRIPLPDGRWIQEIFDSLLAVWPHREAPPRADP